MSFFRTSLGIGPRLSHLIRPTVSIRQIATLNHSKMSYSNQLWSPSPRRALLAKVAFGTGVLFWSSASLYVLSSAERRHKAFLLFNAAKRAAISGHAVVRIAWDYKLTHFKYPEDHPERKAAFSLAHERAADRLLHLAQRQGGVYIKCGQIVHALYLFMPPEYVRAMTPLFTEAPSAPFSEVEEIWQEEFQCHPSDMFQSFDRKPVAAASLGQVRRGTALDGREMAVKVQFRALKDNSA